MKFPLDTSQQVILVAATVVGPKQSHNIRLILDTGASFTMIAPEILVRIGCDPAECQTKKPITTASGLEYVSFLKINTLQALGVECQELEVCSHSLPSTLPARGLLGLNFLRQCNIQLNFLQRQMIVTR